MKAFAFVLLCALAAVQGRSTALQSTRTAAALGEYPWLVHLRVAVATSGLLKTGAGTLINERWVLTAADAINDSRFIWVRLGLVNVINPSLVLETSAVRSHSSSNVALVNLNRDVLMTDYISPIPSPVGEVTDTIADFCIFGEKDGAAGEVLNCYEVDVVQLSDGKPVVLSDDVQATAFDIGAPLVEHGEQIAILVGPGSEDVSGEFLATAPFQEWIEAETGLDLNREAVAVVAPEAVRFVQ